jgi:hypothetical protein
VIGQIRDEFIVNQTSAHFIPDIEPGYTVLNELAKRLKKIKGTQDRFPRFSA